jgi:hypothetical protein
MVSLVAAALLAAGCAGAAPPPDAYDLVTSSLKTGWDPVQVNVGIKLTVLGQTIALDPKDIAILIDSHGGKGAIHVAITASELGVPASAFAKAGIPGDSIDFDVIYAGDALYVKSPMLAPTLKTLLGPVGKLPAGDLTGWLKLGTKDELAAFAAMSGAAARPPSAAPSADVGATTKTSLEGAGIALAIVGTEKHNGVDAEHIKVAIDTAKLAANPAFAGSAGSGAQAAQTLAMLKALALSGDLWLDPASHRILEADLHLAAANNAAQSGDLTVTARDPDGSVSLDPPAATVDVPIGPLFNELMKLVSKSSES